MSEIYKTLGKNIRNYRKEKNLTSVQFANYIGVSTGQLSNLENGKYDIFKLELLNKITSCLEVSLGELLENKSVDVRALYTQETFKKSFVKKMPCDSKEEINLINEQINAVINSYLATISEYQYDTNKILSITSHLVDELQFINSLHICNSKTSASYGLFLLK